MTEQEWLAGSDPDKLLKGLSRKLSNRKKRLFACASCRHVWELIADKRCRAGVLVAERFADGEADPTELDAARVETHMVSDRPQPDDPHYIEMSYEETCRVLRIA
ncbi:hypothetical protein AYO44_13660 [Planctomycetaceae bacterium SCGC AG-212-F19]|nr:hypothetical protein AYO44_13660 [Planctomycetaceae bacterium SCGC AG-212-F19]